MNLDPERAAAAYREAMVAPYRGVLPASAVRSMEEQFSGACTVEIAAFNESTTLLADPAAVADFDHVIFDTAPTGHTFAPAHSSVGVDGIHRYQHDRHELSGAARRPREAPCAVWPAMAALADPARTTLVLVSRPEPSSLREAARASRELRALGIANQQLVVNGVLGDALGDAVAASYAVRQRSALAAMPVELAQIPRRDVPLVAWDLTGAQALRGLLRGFRQPRRRRRGLLPRIPAA